jgi:hypothetical protein
MMIFWVLAGCLIFFLYLYIAWNIQKKENVLAHVPKEIEVANFGSTYAFYDFCYTEVEVKGMNFANVPQYLDYDEILLEKYIHNLKKGAKILFVLPDFVFVSTKTNTKRKVYYEVLKSGEIRDFSCLYLLTLVWKAAQEPFTHNYRNERNKWKGHVASMEEKEKHAQGRIRDWENGLGIISVKSDAMTDENRKNIDVNIERLERMIVFSRDKGCMPYLVIPPISEIMREKISVECLDVYLKEPIKKIAKDTGVEVIDYSYSEEYATNDLYMNSDCLNETGRKKFTRDVLNKIWQRNLIE